MPKKNSSVVVCVTPQDSCLRLIEAGARIAKEENKPLVVLSVFREKNGLNANEGGALEKLYECARIFNARMSIYFNDSPAIVAAVAAKKENASTFVTGFPAEGSSGFIARIHELIPELPITMVDKDGSEYRIIPFSKEDLEAAKLMSIKSVK
ncbi:MAG: hypothetical protein IJB45_01915 [Clostridia bacterium]|nr:hypothetical protein [Clostridia bacterium]